MGKKRNAVEYRLGTILVLKPDINREKLATVRGRLGADPTTTDEELMRMTFIVVAPPTDTQRNPLGGDGVWVKGMAEGRRYNAVNICHRYLTPEKKPEKKSIAENADSIFRQETEISSAVS